MLSVVLGFLVMFFVPVLMMNIMIAVISNVYDRVMEHSIEEWEAEQTQRMVTEVNDHTLPCLIACLHYCTLELISRPANRYFLEELRELIREYYTPPRKSFRQSFLTYLTGDWNIVDLTNFFVLIFWFTMRYDNGHKQDQILDDLKAGTTSFPSVTQLALWFLSCYASAYIFE